MNLFSKSDAAVAEGVPVRTSVRYQVLWMTVLLYAITYMDRVCIYAAMPVIAREFSFDKLTQGLIFSAFAWGYSTLQVPSGWLVDRVGPRRMLSAIVFWWSAFTMITIAAWNTASFVVIRFLFGAGEAGAFPSATRAFSRWLAASERGFAQGVTHSGSRLAGALTHGVVAALIVLWGWRMPFVLFGLIGIVWATVWFFWYRDRPESHPGVSPGELEWINAGKTGGKQVKSVLSWKKLLGRPNMWYVCVMYFCYGYVLWIFLSWLPTYFAEVRGFSLIKSGVYTMIPLLAGTLTNSLGGWFSDRLYVRTGNLRYSRQLVASAGFGIAVVFVTMGVLSPNPTVAVLAMSLAVGGLELTTGVSWAVPLDIGHDHSGTVSGVMNMFGNFGGAVSPLLVAWLVQRFDSWTPPFVLASFLCLVAGLLWFRIDPTISVVEEIAGEAVPAH
jgi:sugar phosphate permease